MFEIDNHTRIIQLIQAKHKQAFVVPIYIQIYKDQYTLNEIKEIQSFNPSGMRIGFGAKISIFDKHSFPKNKIMMYDIEAVFTEYNEEKNVDERFIVFSAGITSTTEPLTNEVDKQIAYYFNMIKDYLTKQCEEIRKKRIAEQISSQSLFSESE